MDAVVTLGRGCHLYKRDLPKAFSRIHLWQPSVLTIGLRSAAMVFQRSTSAVAWIASQQCCLVFNYLDDFIGVSLALTAHTDFQALSDLLSSLGLQESSAKSCLPLYSYNLFRCRVEHRHLHSFCEPCQNLQNWMIARPLDSKTDSH